VAQLTSPGFALRLGRALAESGADAATLVLDLDAGALPDGDRDLAAVLADLRALGVRIALDDFGSGAASLAQVRTLPVDVLKVPAEALTDRGDRTAHEVATAIVALGQRLGLRVVAEGIETPAQLARVRALGIVEGQGYLLAAPGPAEALRRARRTSAPA
jgi:EAL domain-containing protein (putative c-di-GMP-specific phosphodiesterase class I)